MFVFVPCDRFSNTRIVVHLQDALESGCTTCLVRTVDTDVLVILIGKYHFLASKYPSADIWVAFGSGKNFLFLHINAICSTLGKEKSTALPVFHSFTGCDTTSSFFGKGKKSVWEAWGAYTEVTDAFNFIVEHPHAQITVDCQEFQMLERFTVVIYDKNSPLVSVNEARKELFCQKNRTMENIPPTQQPCCSTPSVQCTRLASGQPVTRPNNRHQLLKAGVWDTGCRNKVLGSCLELAACGSKGCK
ncbi:hypothetical protein GWK47_016650 [Chionoecetes opilio]|uniref:Uncharacterized protein n=1 Tax=Chionoecetes opilio TaxID=41210 RepID=A0A8J5BYZ4_CHIOP|nr:hypothetical protein GWK47_016650 [Chionoecetes opilio]